MSSGGRGFGPELAAVYDPADSMSSIPSDVARPASRAIAAAEALAASILDGPGCLSPAFRRGLVRQIALGRAEEGDAKDRALAGFALALARHPLSIGAGEVESLRALASEEEILETAQAAGVSVLERTLARARGEPDGWSDSDDAAPRQEGTARPFAKAPISKPGEFPPFDALRERLGFVPALYRAQLAGPAALDAQVRALGDILLDDGALERRRKELVLLAVSAANSNTYCVAVHAEILRNLGVPPEESEAVACDESRPGLPAAEKALLDAAAALAASTGDFVRSAKDLLAGGFSTAQVQEMAATAALAAFLNTVERGLNPKPDFRPRRDFAAERRTAEKERAAADARSAGPDPDADLVARARSGEAAAFEGLVRRHQSSVYRTLAGVTGRAEDAEDCTQAVFVKVFRRLDDFSGAARFSTWLTRIAINEGLEALRRRRPEVSLDTDGSDDSEFRPANLAAWVDDPERLYARDELRRIVRERLAKLPDRYRVVVFLRDIQQLTTAEAAAALGIPVPALKTRLLRGRLMLREVLAPLFQDSASAKGGTSGV
jgi:RNA polymerase sigma-70 factor (ECF subfamily)